MAFFPQPPPIPADKGRRSKLVGALNFFELRELEKNAADEKKRKQDEKQERKEQREARKQARKAQERAVKAAQNAGGA